MNEIIERVAKAFYEEESGLAWDQCMITGRKWRLRAAKAAIRAMREPTEGMIKSIDGLNYDCLVGYQIMIEAALKE